MFEALRKNIQTVQDGITSGLQRFSISDKTSSTPTEYKINFNAGSDILQFYQTKWATMHLIAEENAKQAEKLDSQITELVEECEKQHNQVVEIHSLLAHLPNIMSQLHSMLTTIGSVHNLYEETESELLSLENLEEELALQEKILDMKLNLTVVRQNRNHQFDQLRNELTTDHKLKVIQLEKLRESDRKEKETLLANQFLQDVKQYQEHGCLLKRGKEEKDTLKLEDVELDEDLSKLDVFLNNP